MSKGAGQIPHRTKTNGSWFTVILWKKMHLVLINFVGI